MKTKTCRGCGKDLPLDHFYSHQKTRDRKQQRCISCTRNALRVVKRKQMLEASFVRLHANAEKLTEAIAKTE